MSKVFNLKSYIIATLRRATYRFPARYNVMNKARISRGKYQCNICKNILSRKEIRMDHIEPVVNPLIGFTTWDDYITRMFVPESGWQALCLKCDKEKQTIERAIRKETKKELDKIKEFK